MKLRSIHAGLLVLGATAVCGQALDGSYTGPYRPQVHFSPPRNYMNDPNGLFVDDSGTWHLYYQYNPTNISQGNQHWGHATSNDLYHWKNQPIAISPPADGVFVYSGSAVIDKDNTSGFFPNQTNGVVAIYTLASDTSQQQAISYSKDGGYTFTAYQGNPVIPNNSTSFRDPKVIRYRNQWVMAVAWSEEAKVGIYTSPNLKDWTPTSTFSAPNQIGSQFECPNLIPIPYIDQMGKRRDNMWLMYIGIASGAPAGGSIDTYFPGTFNGTHFKPVDSTTRIADFAQDNYAGQFYYGTNIGEAPKLIAWASNVEYSGDTPTEDEGWRGTMTLPRETYLTKLGDSDWRLVSRPYELSSVLGNRLAATDNLAKANLTVNFSNVASNALYWEVDITGIPNSGTPSAAVFNFTFATSRSGESISGSYNLFDDYTFTLDRSGARGFEKDSFEPRFTTRSAPKLGSWSMTGVMDRSILEVFLNGGEESATSLFFTTEPLSSLTVTASSFPDGVNASVSVNALASSWTAGNNATKREVAATRHAPLRRLTIADLT